MTGGASGLGLEVVKLMAEEGASVVLADVDADAGTAAADALVRAGYSVVFQRSDIREERDVIEMIARCRSEFGRFNIIHNNAGVQVEARLHETTTEQWDHLSSVNLRGMFFGCKHAVIDMREHEGGSIVNTASLLAITADAFLPAYTATKTGVLGLTRAIAIDYFPEGIRCNAICPGDMDTPLVQKYVAATDDPAATLRALEEASPAKRLAHPREVAAAVVFLASDDASFVNGASFVADGGLSIKTY
ncbi:SDR family oxidoreductase [Mycobacterium sp. DSM 3803]|nr:SDR family oxidoreductase [Mycobacterium sp. DSM 3803]